MGDKHKVVFPPHLAGQDPKGVLPYLASHFVSIQTLCDILQSRHQTDTCAAVTMYKSTGGDLPSMPEMLRFKVPELVGDVFFKFGVLLLNDTTGQKMIVIKQDCGDDYSHIVRVTLKKWIKGEGLPVKWKTLVKTLRDCDLISLAAEIEAKKINGIYNEVSFV